MSDPPDAVLAAALSERPVRELDPLASRASYGTVAVDFGTGTDPLVLKYTRVAGWRLRKEAALLDHVDDVDDVPVPAVRSVGTVEDGEEWTFLLTTKCAGATGRAVLDGEPGRAPEVVRSMGRVLARLHGGTAFQHPGAVVAAADAAGVDDAGNGGDDAPTLALVETPTTWTGVLDGLVGSMADVLAGTTFERSAERARRVLEDRLDDLAVPDPVLVHGDPSPRNVHFADGALSCLLDWEYAKAGDPAFDLTTAESQLFDGVDDAHREALLDGYREVRPVPAALDRRRDRYRVVHVVGSMVGLAGGSESEGSTTVDPERGRRARAELDRCVERLEGEEQA